MAVVDCQLYGPELSAAPDGNSFVLEYSLSNGVGTRFSMSFCFFLSFYFFSFYSDEKYTHTHTESGTGDGGTTGVGVETEAQRRAIQQQP
jgi:hypothetical protein